MKKIVFIGAGSLDFTRDLVRDLLSFPAFDDCQLWLVDIDGKRLSYAKLGVEKIILAGGYHASVFATTQRQEALANADAILITVLQGGVEVWRHDIEIPMKYGIDICVGDTRGPSGIFRFLRTAPVLLGIIRDVEELCPKAIVLNYTNPMAMLVSFLQAQTNVSVTGLCHSVQGTADMLAGWLGIPSEALSYTCVGINHQAFYISLTSGGKDQYPALFEAIQREEVANEEPVRIEMFKYLKYFTTESSGHNSEYNAWFRKRPDLIARYCINGTGWNPGAHAYILNEYLEREHTWEGNRKFLLIVLVPVFAQVFVFMLLPIFGTAAISFMEYNPLQAANRFIALENYLALLKDEMFFTALKNTLVFTLITVLLNILISLTTATMISQLKSNKTRSFFRMIVFLPCMAPIVASSVVWARSIYQTKGGLLNAVLAFFGADAISWIGDARYLMLSVIVFTIWADIGYNVILFSAGIDGIPRDLFQAAELDGAGRWRMFRFVTLPLLGRTMTFVSLMTLISHFQMFAQFNVLALKDGPQSSGLVLTSLIYKTAFVYKEMGYAAAISMVLFLIILLVTLVQQRLGKVDWEY